MATGLRRSCVGVASQTTLGAKSALCDVPFSSLGVEVWTHIQEAPSSNFWKDPFLVEGYPGIPVYIAGVPV